MSQHSWSSSEVNKFFVDDSDKKEACMKQVYCG